MADFEFHQPERAELVRQLGDALGDETVCQTAWACIWLCDIDRLKRLVYYAKEAPELVDGYFKSIETSAKLVQTWTQRKRKPTTSEQNRSRQARELCFTRDKQRCVLTESGEALQVAHIFPYSMRTELRDAGHSGSSFWNGLKAFWPPDKIDEWYDSIFVNGTEVVQNLITLSRHTHGYWERGLFALKPLTLSLDEKKLDVELHWLNSYSKVNTMRMSEVPVIDSNLDQGRKLSKLYNHQTDTKIISGTIIVLETDDPITKPLPDRRILDMQWFLHRITALSGAAELLDEDVEDDSEDEIRTPSSSKQSFRPMMTGRSTPALNIPVTPSLPLLRGGEAVKDEQDAVHQDSPTTEE